MKVLYSQMKELVPELKATPREVGEALTLIGFMLDSFVEVSYKGTKDYLLGLEVRQNRADCLSVIGLTKEVAAYYNLQISIPQIQQIVEGEKKLDIQIEAADYVKRVLAVEIDEIKNEKSPEWLKEYLSFYDLNSVNLLVDLSNYVMLFTGYSSHLIDREKTAGKIKWSLNYDFDEVTTLLGTPVKLQKNKELIIRDEKNIIALAGIVGGTAAAIDIQTKSIIAEIAIYDCAIVRKNSRNLNVVTEASHRLEKDLDPNGADYAMNLLVNLILKYGGGRVASSLFDYYPRKHIPPKIKFKTNLPSKFAGIEIEEKDVLKVLKNLGFTVEEEESGSLLITPPIGRPDVSLPEDLTEEVLRIYGYDRIPAQEMPKLEIVPNITPSNIILAEKIRDILNALSMDEILSWPLTREGDDEFVNYRDWRVIYTQNSVNDIYPCLRQSIVVGLVKQLDEYHKKNVDFINIFEIGKIFGEAQGKHIELEALGMMSVSRENSMTEFKNKTETLLRLLGFANVKYLQAEFIPKAANPNSCWYIYAEEQKIGILYKFIPSETKLNVYASEIDITKINELLLKTKNNPIVEITQKLVTLDANVELEADESIFKYLKKVKSRLEKNNVWSINVSDIYPLESKIRYTIRVVYKELPDQEAKKKHLKAFELE